MKKKTQIHENVTNDLSSAAPIGNLDDAFSEEDALNRGTKYLTKPLKLYVSEIGTRNRGDSGYRVYSVTNSDGFVPSEDYFKKQVFSKNTANYKIVPPGDFAYNPSRINVGSIDYLRQDSPVLVSPLYIVFRSSQELHPPYLKRFLLSETGLSQIDHHTQGAVRDSLKFSGLQKIEIPLPPLDEQRRIAALLDKADALRRQRQESLQLTEKLLRSVFLDMFGDPVTNSKNLPIRKLGDFFSSPKEGAKCGPFGSALKKSDTQRLGVPVWGIDNISADGHFVDRAFTRISKEKFDELKSYKAANGDILISRAGTVGKMCVTNSTEGIGIIGSNLIRLRLKADLLSPHWFVSFMKYSKERVARLRAGADGAFTHMSTKILQGLEFPYPTPELQNDFLESCQAVERISKLGTGSSNYLDKFFSSLQQRAFRGELDLSRLVLVTSENSSPIPEPERPAAKARKLKFPTIRFHYPRAIAAKLKELEHRVSKGEPIEWSTDYFKYHIIGAQQAQFGFSEIMQKAAAVFDEPPPYEAIKDLILEMLGQGGGPTFLNQRFDEKRKEIVFELAP
jgi:type I restriction enzyme S subunit